MTLVLDEQARGLLRTLQPGDLFVMRGLDNTVIRCDLITHPVEGEPYVRGQEMEGPKGHRRPRMFRAVRISNVDKVVTE